MKILANEGIHESGKVALEQQGFEVLTTKIAPNQLENYINEYQVDALVVRNNTEVREELIDACPSLKLIAKAGTDMDNIDVEYAIDHGLHVINTPEASAIAIAELTFAHLMGMSRFLQISNREMPLEGDLRFNDLKRTFSAGIELKGKTLGIIGFQHIGQEVAKIALGLGMKVLATDPRVESAPIELEFFNGQKTIINIETSDFDTILKESDFITIHTENQDGYILSKKEFDKMKTGVGILNLSQSGALDEMALIAAIKNKTVRFAGLDVFETQPNPEIQLLMNPNLSLSPNIGTLTLEAQERMGLELAQQISKLLKAEYSNY